jgi:hypothetical protein
MEDTWQSRLRAGVGDSELWSLRKHTAVKTARDFIAVGTLMSLPNDSDEETSDAIHAVSLLLQMAGELAVAAGRLLSDGEHYAGAALLRQVVEIEYLTWTFKEGHRSASKWLQSTYEERMSVFSPGKLRQTSKGRFLREDYKDHCEQGGHPVPRGSLLLGAKNPGSAQILLVDLIVHCWRTWDQVVQWSIGVPYASAIVLGRGRQISSRLNKWGQEDPIYALMVERDPEKKS